MATYTITTNSEQERGLTHVVGMRNAERAAATPPEDELTNQAYLELVLASVFESYTQQAGAAVVTDVSDKLSLLDDAAKKKVTDVLNIEYDKVVATKEAEEAAAAVAEAEAEVVKK